MVSKQFEGAVVGMRNFNPNTHLFLVLVKNFGDIAGNFYAINRNNPTQLWSVQTGSDIVGMPLLTEDGIYFTNEAGTLYALTREGTTRWTQKFDATLHTGPISAGDLILVATDEEGLVLYAIDSEGLQRWQFSPSSDE